MSATNTLAGLLLLTGLVGCQVTEQMMDHLSDTVRENSDLTAEESPTPAGAPSSSDATAAGSAGSSQSEQADPMSSDSRQASSQSGSTAEVAGVAGTASTGAAADYDPSAVVFTNQKGDVDSSGTERYGWTDAKVGWMVHYRMPGGNESIEEVVEADDRLLLMERTFLSGGNVVSKSRSWAPRYYKKVEAGAVEEQPEFEVEVIELPDETLKIDGKSVKCKVSKAITKMPGQTMVSVGWTSEEVPNMMVKSEMDADGQGLKVVSELIAFRK